MHMMAELILEPMTETFYQTMLTIFYVPNLYLDYLFFSYTIIALICCEQYKIIYIKADIDSKH